uniref:CARD domain-containing protein n=1 Tax=Seriola dumerili TaxID=41447 RepID=A0A3B4VPR4_SERDU
DRSKELNQVLFVNRVSNPVIMQLLDDLVSDAVLNDQQRESILEENPTRAGKARCLIDTVRRKGDDTSRRMIAPLHRIDPILHSELGLGLL